jgi:ribonuclease R
MDVEREVMDLYRALYMRAHIGETFEGTVTGMVGAGAFVSLDSPFVDVMVRADAMGKDRYELDDDGMQFIGRRSGDVVALGDRIVVTIEDVAILRRTTYAWRHAPDMADAAPLRHSPFRADEKPQKKRENEKQKRRIGASERPPAKPKRAPKPTSKRPSRGKRR